MAPYLHRFGGVLLTGALLLPVAAAIVVVLARRRVRGGLTAGAAWRRSVAEVGMVAGTVPWLVMGLWPIDLPPGVARWHLVPLSDIAGLLSGPPGDAFVQIVANLLVFFAVGMFAPLRSRKLADPMRLVLLGSAGSLALEVCQQAFGTGRVFSVDDVLLNGLGCLLGGLVTRPYWLPAQR